MNNDKNFVQDLIKLVLSSGYENDSPVLGLQSTLQEKLKDIFYKYDSVVEKDHVTLVTTIFKIIS